MPADGKLSASSMCAVIAAVQPEVGWAGDGGSKPANVCTIDDPIENSRKQFLRLLSYI